MQVTRPSSPQLADAVALSATGVRGRWMDYGNRVVLGEDLPPFAQTTAIALISLSGQDPDLEARGLSTLRRLWRVESAGGLSLATTLVAFRVHGEATDAVAVRFALERLISTTKLLEDAVALGWAALALDAPLPGGDA
jgi:hypothetical protein